jgi:phage terminase large subunit-like protein
VAWGQGFRDMGPAVTALEREVQDRTLVHPENPVLTWAVGNATSMMDAAGNKKLDKEAARFRIDPAVAMTMALGLKSRDRKAPPKEIQFF